VPKPRGSDETLDDPEEVASDEAADRVETALGDSIRGHVTAIDADGSVRISSPSFEGEVKVRRDAVTLVELVATAKGVTGDEIVLANGDRLLGELTELDEKELVVETAAAGPVRVPRKIVTRISTRRGGRWLLETDFASGMGPWKSRSGNWTIRGERLHLLSGGGNHTVAAPLDQDDAVTMEVDLRAGPSGLQYATLVVGASSQGGVFGTNAVYAMFGRNQCYMGFADASGNTRSLASPRIPSSTGPNQPAKLRLGVDFETLTAKAWLNGALVCETKFPKPSAAGKFVMIGSQQPLSISSVRVVRGLEDDAIETEVTEIEDDGALVVFANGDRLTAKDLRMTEEGLSVETGHGTLDCPLERVRRIVFPSAGIEKPEEREGDVRVETRGGRFTVKLVSMDGESLRGESAVFGEIAIARSHVRKIRFGESE
jgi:hypothetical protein